MRLLIVEDEIKTGDYLKQGLTEAGFQVSLVRNGLDGHHLAMTEVFDLIVLDVMLPDINGKEVCQRVRSDKSMDSVQIICISGMVEDDKVDGLKQAGANDFMRKPFEVDRLIERICQLLQIETAAVT